MSISNFQKISRRNFLINNAGIGLGCALATGPVFEFLSSCNTLTQHNSKVAIMKTGCKELFADDSRIAQLIGLKRKIHSAMKLEHPVLEADMPWEQGDEYDGKRDRRVYIYGTVLKNNDSGLFRMWYNHMWTNFYATSLDGINWQRPVLGQLGQNNMIQLFDFHSPSFILDKKDPDPAKRYKAIGSKRTGNDPEEVRILKEKFKTNEWYVGSSAYCAAYSSDGINWNLYPHPVLISGDTITLSQDPLTGEYLAFHKRSRDPRVKGRQIFLSVSKDMQNWSESEPVMVTDEMDHQEARKLKGGTHSEFYNMSAFPYGNQWLGLVTHFRRTGSPPVKGPVQSKDDGLIDVQLVYSRNGRKWERCSDRTPVIPLGPFSYDSGSILGICNSPVIVGDEMWMYYTAMTTSHGGYLPEKELSIARASWRLDGMVSMKAGYPGGMIETITFIPEGNELFVNADITNGNLRTEILDGNGKVIRDYENGVANLSGQNFVKMPIKWNNSSKLPEGKPIRIRFYIENGDLFSYTIE